MIMNIQKDVHQKYIKLIMKMHDLLSNSQLTRVFESCFEKMTSKRVRECPKSIYDSRTLSNSLHEAMFFS